VNLLLPIVSAIKYRMRTIQSMVPRSRLLRAPGRAALPPAGGGGHTAGGTIDPRSIQRGGWSVATGNGTGTRSTEWLHTASHREPRAGLDRCQGQGRTINRACAGLLVLPVLRLVLFHLLLIIVS
jgi:hypothetical protein